MPDPLTGKELESLRDAIVGDFEQPDTAKAWLLTWLNTPARNENVNNVFYGATFNDRVNALLQWAEAIGAMPELMQQLVDRPPAGKRLLRGVVFVVSRGAILARSAGGIPPVDPHRDWFVTKRPFANRQDLREALATFDAAAPGPECVLVIEGDHSTGKSHGVRFAKQCAPSGRYVSVDVAQFDTGQMNVEDLAKALTKQDTVGFPPVDLTKEHEAVPRVLIWLTSKLSNTNVWLIVDHCDRPNLTEAARSLLIRMAGAIDDLTLPGVRLILADIARNKLPNGVQMFGRYDRAVLPDQGHVQTWCEELAAHLGRVCDATELKSLVTEVFKDTAQAAKDDVPFAVEQGLARAAKRILALPKKA